MKRISPVRKASVLAKLLSPYNMTVAAVAQIEGISQAILYNWRNQARLEGKPAPGAEKTADQWSADAHFAAIVETATVSEAGRFGRATPFFGGYSVKRPVYRIPFPAPFRGSTPAPGMRKHYT